MSDYVGVTLKELDYSTSVQSQAVTGAGFAGGYTWGPIEQPFTITNLDNYAITFGKPVVSNKISYLTAASYLDYSDNLRVVRVVGEGTQNATSIKYDYAKFILSNVLGTIEVGAKFTNVAESEGTVVSFNEVSGELTVKNCTGVFSVSEVLTFSNIPSSRCVITVYTYSFLKISAMRWMSRLLIISSTFMHKSLSTCSQREGR